MSNDALSLKLSTITHNMEALISASRRIHTYNEALARVAELEAEVALLKADRLKLDAECTRLDRELNAQFVAEMQEQPR